MSYLTKHKSKFIIIIFILSCLSFGGFFAKRAFEETLFYIMMDGPFLGRVCTETVGRLPDQRFDLFDGLFLETFDVSVTNKYPVVMLRDRQNQLKWCVDVTAEYGSVQKVRFNELKQSWFYEPTIQSEVWWTYGHEVSRWKITKKGVLVGYWFSW